MYMYLHLRQTLYMYLHLRQTLYMYLHFGQPDVHVPALRTGEVAASTGVLQAVTQVQTRVN